MNLPFLTAAFCGPAQAPETRRVSARWSLRATLHALFVAALGTSPAMASPAGWASASLNGAPAPVSAGLRVQARADNEDGACFFMRPNMQGNATCFGIDRFGRLPANLAGGFSSFELLGNARLTLCSGQKFGGNCQTFTRGQRVFNPFQAAAYRSMIIEVAAANGAGGAGETPPPLPPQDAGAQNPPPLPPRLPPVRRDATCFYYGTDFRGQPTCHDNSRIWRFDNLGAIKALTLADNAYVYICTGPRFTGFCERQFGDVADLPNQVDDSRADNYSAYIVPDAATPRLYRHLTADMRAGQQIEFAQGAPYTTTHGGGATELEVFMSEQGLALRPVNGAFLFSKLPTARNDALYPTGVQACMTRMNTDNRTGPRYMLLSQIRAGQKLCVFTNDADFAVLSILSADQDQLSFSYAITQ